MWVGLLLLSASGAAECTFQRDGVAVEGFDCERGGAWSVTCGLPEARSGRAQVHLRVPARGIEATAPLSLQAAQEGSTTLALGGPGNRAGTFVVSTAAAGMLPGQAVGPLQLCPVVQPDVTPGAPRAVVELEVAVTVHTHEGFEEQVGPGGVITRVPRWSAGVPHATGTAPVRQREVGDIPVLSGADALPQTDDLSGMLQIVVDGTWRSLGFTGLRQVVDGPARVSTFDFVAAEVEAALGAPASASLEQDLAGWLAGEETALGRVAWARTEVTPPGPLAFASTTEAGVRWRRARADDDRLEARVMVAGDRARVVIASGTLGPAVLEAATASLDD